MEHVLVTDCNNTEIIRHREHPLWNMVTNEGSNTETIGNCDTFPIHCCKLTRPHGGEEEEEEEEEEEAVSYTHLTLPTMAVV